jgi:hypothetical protein
MSRKFIGIAVAAALVASMGSVVPVASAARSKPVTVAATQPAPITSKETGIRFTSKTISVDRTTVTQNLIGIASDGTFKFRAAAGAIAKLKAGKVMLLQGSDARLVSSVAHGKGTVVLVHTKPAVMTDVISSGHITFAGSPDFRRAFLSKIVPAPKSAAPPRFAKPAYPYVARSAAPDAGPPSFSASGSSGPFGYSLTFTPVSSSRLDVSGTLCFVSGSVCANGRSNGLSAEINLSGYIDAGATSGGISVNGGRVTGSTISLKSLKAHAHLTYTISQGTDPATNGDPPVFRVPIGIDYTIPGEIPIYLKLQTAVLLRLGVSSKNAVIHGGVNVDTAGADSITQQGSNISDSETGDSVQAKILDQSNGGVPPSISSAPSGTIVAVQFPKLGVGLGITAANGIAYVDVVSAVGQTTGGAIAGMFCSSYNVDISVGAGLEAQIGLGKLGLSVASAKKTLYDKTFSTHDPGCPQT